MIDEDSDEQASVRWQWLADILERRKEITDVHVTGGVVHLQTADGRLFPAGCDPVPRTFVTGWFEDYGEDYALTLSGYRIRIHVALRGEGLPPDMNVRILPSRLYSLADMQVDPALMAISRLRRGFVVIAGPTGSRKTSLAGAFLGEIARTRAVKIATVEEPVELEFPKDSPSPVTSKDTTRGLSYHTALMGLYREKPNVVFVGETREEKAIEVSLDLSKSGCFVMTTLHAGSVAEVYRQIVGRIETGKQESVRNDLADLLTAVIVHRMEQVRGGGEILLREYAFPCLDPAIGEHVRKNDLFKIRSRIGELADQLKPGFVTFDHARKRLEKQGVVFDTSIPEVGQ